MEKDKVAVASKKVASEKAASTTACTVTSKKPKKKAGVASKKAASKVASSATSKQEKKPRSRSKKKSKLASPPFTLVENRDESTTTTTTAASAAASFDESLEGVARLLEGRKNVVVLVGAGLSTSVGIPDFRSKDGGLYNSLDTDAMGLSCPEELFCISFFEDNPQPFYRFARHLYFPLGMDQQVEPSDSHKLLALLEEKKMLLRVYSQNIDGLEAVAGVSNKKMVYAHGSLGWANCMRCGKKVTSEEILSAIKRGVVPRCQVPRKKRSSSVSSTSSATTGAAVVTAGSNSGVSSNSPAGSSRADSPSSREPSRTRAAKKRPRAVASLFTLTEDASSNGMDEDNNDIEINVNPNLFCGGVLKPGVTFFGETLNDNVRKKIESDRTKADALVVIGTSLSVAPISKIIGYLPSNIPRILINRTIVRPSTSSSSTSKTAEESVEGNNDDEEVEPDFRDNYAFDAYLLGNCDDVTRSLARKLFRSSVGGGPISQTHPVKRAEEKKRRKTNSDEQMQNIQSCGELLLHVLEGKEENWKASEWSRVEVPSERVLLFPGALSSNDDSSSAQVEYREVAHCDGCTKQIHGVIKKCVNCFDYDLCAKCFPALSKTHFDGTHSFHSENATT